MMVQTVDDHVWGIILAGGNGQRVQDFTRRLCGEARPKQYCAFTGKRSLLRHTIDRVKHIIPAGKIVTVVNDDHLIYANHQLHDHSTENIIIQPQNKDTGPGILLPLLKLYGSDRDAVVGIFPSDHFIKEEGRFRDYVRVAISFVSVHPEIIVTLGAVPDQPEQAYGWIQVGKMVQRHLDKTLHRVDGFWEKPTAEAVQTLHAEGCLWNTMILIGKVETFLKNFQTYTPELFSSLQKVSRIPGSSERERLGQVFAEIPSINFSRAILERIPRHLCVIPLKGVYWSDWGDEFRIISDCKRFGLVPPEESRGCRTVGQRVQQEIVAVGLNE
ncbi:MAG TPA: sugar phosphate nucleotidyltransferase [Bacteroidota bacterium]|jgi:mannose-1-phosphate guanylyltransferase|nr:sugar phosphate nucleotidyltransferase [Bacteroidota bacterium]